MGTLTLGQFNRIPSIGALFNTQSHKSVLDQINRELGSASFFGSVDDPFASQHEFFVEKVINPIRFVASQFKQQYKELQEPDMNVFRPIISVADLEYGIPECMWEAVAQHPVVKSLAKQNRVDLFGMEVKNLPEENVYDRLIANGVSTFTAQDLKESKGTYIEEVDWRSTDPKLSVEDIEAVEDTYDFISIFYKDLDAMYDKLGKTYILHDKSYMSEGIQLRDLDITAFPNRKG